MAWSQSSPVSKRGYDLAAVSPSSVHLGVVSVDVLAREAEHLGVVGAFVAGARMVCSRVAAPASSDWLAGAATGCAVLVTDALRARG